MGKTTKSHSGVILWSYVCNHVAFLVLCSDFGTTLMISLSHQLHFIKLSTVHSCFYIRPYLRAVKFEFGL